MLRLIVGLLLVSTVLAKGGKGSSTARVTSTNTVATSTDAADTTTVAAATTDETTTETASANTTIDLSGLVYVEYLETHPTPGVMTVSAGAPVKRRDAYNSLNRNILLIEKLMEQLSHSVAETIPARIIHEKGSGASGYFEVTHDITSLSKAKMFSEIGKQTPVRVRFSNSITAADTARDTRGFAVKFYTEDGNFDIVGFNTPVIFFSDPTKFNGIVHVLKANPVTGFVDPNSLLDWITYNEEVLLIMTMFYTDTGTPASYRNMPGHSLNAFQLCNANNEIHFARFHFIAYNETKLSAAEAATLAGQDPDYLARDLYNGIAAGDYPEWTVGIQVMTLDEIIEDPRLIDVSRYIPEYRIPIQPIGKLVLNKNPENWFAEFGQIQFLPSNLVPGIQAPLDKTFQGRALAYRLAANHRVGVNFNKIPVNQPLGKPLTYNKDGPPPVLDNEGAAPTYWPNSFNGPEPIDDDEPENAFVEELPANNRDQVDEYYRTLPEDQKAALIQNLGAATAKTTGIVQERFLKLVNEINEEYGTRLAAEVARLTAASQ